MLFLAFVIPDNPICPLVLFVSKCLCCLKCLVYVHSRLTTNINVCNPHFGK